MPTLPEIFKLYGKVRALDSESGIWYEATILKFIDNYTVKLQWDVNVKNASITQETIPTSLRRLDTSEWTILPPLKCSSKPALAPRSILLLCSDSTLDYGKKTRCRGDQVCYAVSTSLTALTSVMAAGFVLENDPFREQMLVTDQPPISGSRCRDGSTPDDAVTIAYWQLRAKSTAPPLPASTKIKRERRFSELSSSTDSSSTEDSPPRRGAPRRTGEPTTSPRPILSADFATPAPAPPSAAASAPPAAAPARPTIRRPFFSPSAVPISIPCAPCINGILHEGMLVTTARIPTIKFRVRELYFANQAMVKAQDFHDPDWCITMPVWALFIVTEGAEVPALPPPSPAHGPALAFWAYSSLRDAMISRYRRASSRGVVAIQVCLLCPATLQAFGMSDVGGPASYSLNEDERGSRPTSALDHVLGDKWDLIRNSPIGTLVIHHVKMVASAPATAYFRYIKALVRSVPADVVPDAAVGEPGDYRETTRVNLIYSQADKHLHAVTGNDDEADEEEERDIY